MRIVHGIIGSFVLMVGILQFCWCIRDSVAAVQASGWPTAVGTVSHSEVYEDRGGRGVAYVPKVTYNFDVRGRNFTGSRVYFNEGGEIESSARRVISSLPVGAHVSVHYNPAQPADSVLYPGLRWTSFAWLGLSVAGIVFGAVRIWLSLAKRESLRAPPNTSLERTRDR